jgi:hypothetical protein
MISYMRESELLKRINKAKQMCNACTKRYLLKLIILIITHYHSTLRMTNSISPAGCPPITALLALFFFIFSSLMFDIVLFCRRPRQLPPMRDQIFIPNLLRGASQFLSLRITRSCVPLMPEPAAANLAPVNSFLGELE